ncbi:MAG: replicative DNA helicase [Clostridia bacterium]|nr:replicative DNA helicase [Deltaproteobacteria bacterium]
MEQRSGKVPPQDTDAERSVLGAMLLERAAVGECIELLKPDDFYRPAHAAIYHAVLGLFEKNEPIDEVTVASHMKMQGSLDGAGGLEYINALTDATPTAANAVYYARIVRDSALSRRLIAAATAIATSGYESGADVEVLLDEAEAKIFEITSAREHRSYTPLKEVVKEAFKRIETLYEKRSMVTGVPTGFVDLDRMTAGFQPSDLIIIAGRPSMGKTAVALNIAQNAAVLHNVPSLVFSLEMSKEALVMRMLCSEARIDSQRMRGGNLQSTDWPKLARAAGALAEAPMFLDDTGAISVLEMRAKARRLQAERGLGLVMVDYLQLMRGRASSEGREREISEISRGLKSLAKELSVPVIALSQLNRSLEQRQDKRPMLSDLRECVTGDTLVVLADGQRVPIAELVGSTPRVLAMAAGREIVPADSDKVWCVGTKPVFEVALASGRALRATAKHRVFAAKGWVQVGDLTAGDRLALARGFAVALNDSMLHPAVTNSLSWDRVVTITPVGDQLVYDLTVPGPESWLADGLVVHNSGALEQDADVICFVYRDEYYNKETSVDKGVAEFIIGKQRNGPTGTVRLKFFNEFTKFETLAKDD